MPQIREDRLEALLGELVRQVRIDDDTIDWIITALKDSHRDEKAYREQQVATLHAEVRKLQDRLDTIYDDRLDGKVSEQFWQRRTREWQSRQLELLSSIEQHQKADHFYFEEGARIMRLAQRAYDLWVAQPQSEKLSPTYRKPFCWLAEGPVRSVWRG